MTERAWHRGSCHCGRATFEVEAELHACNCSICFRLGYQHVEPFDGQSWEDTVSQLPGLEER